MTAIATREGRATFPLKASSPGGWLKVGLRSRNVGHKYAGAAKVVDPNGAETPAVPKYPCKDIDGHAFDYMNSFDLLQFRSSPQFIYIPAGATDHVVKVLLANAGAATLPTNFLLSKSGVWYLPSGGAE